MGRWQTTRARSVDGHANFSTHSSRASAPYAHAPTTTANSERDAAAGASDNILSAGETPVSSYAAFSCADTTTTSSCADTAITASNCADIAIITTRGSDHRRTGIQSATFSRNGSTLDAKKGTDGWSQGARRWSKAGTRHCAFGGD